MSKIDPVRFEGALSYLPIFEALWFSSLHKPPAKVALRHREARAEALRASWPVVAPGLKPRPAAEAIASELLRYLASASWTEQRRYDELPLSAFERHRVMHRIAKLTKGETICWRLVFDALKKVRPVKG
ncbi:MAG: hypothetical protein ACRYG8_08195 [Janthinobacterium lividum]